MSKLLKTLLIMALVVANTAVFAGLILLTTIESDRGQLYLYLILTDREGNLVPVNKESPFLVADEPMIGVNLIWTCNLEEVTCVSIPITPLDASLLSLSTLVERLPDN